MEHQPRAAQQDPATPWTAAPAETSASTHRPAGSTRQWSVTSTTIANHDFWGPHHQSSGSSSPVLTPFAIGLLWPTIIYRIGPTWPGSRRFGVSCSIDRGGTSVRMKGWIPAYAEERHSPYTEKLGGMTDEKQGLDSRLRRKHPSEAPLAWGKRARWP